MRASAPAGFSENGAGGGRTPGADHVRQIPSSCGKNVKIRLQALIFDSWFDSYQGVVVLIRIVEGGLKVKDRIKFKHTGEEYEVLKMAVNTPFFTEIKGAGAGRSGHGDLRN